MVAASGRADRTYHGKWQDVVHALAHHAEGAHLRADRAASSPRPRRRCPSGRAACATGTTATAGCATRPSRCYSLMTAGYVEGSGRLARLVAARGRPATPGTCRSCTARAASAGSPSTSCRWLAGYEESTPVRVGNAASRAVPARRLRRGLDALHQTRQIDVEATIPNAWVAAARDPRVPGRRRGSDADEGIWEVRGDRDSTSRTRRSWRGSRSIARCKAIEQFGLDGPVDRWRALRDEIHDEVCERGLRRRAQHVHAVLRLEEPRRQHC